MKKPGLILAASLMILSMPGCTPHSSAPVEFQTVTLPGTGDSQDLLREIAEKYTAQFPNRRVIVPDTTGSAGGVEVVGKGTAPIGRVSRLPNTEERAQ